MKPTPYRRQHEKALAKIVDKIADAILAEEADLTRKIAALKLAPETLESLAGLQDTSSRRHQTTVLKRKIRKILIDSRNLLIATIVDKMDN